MDRGVILVKHRNGVAKYKKNTHSFAFVKDASLLQGSYQEDGGHL